MKHYFKFATREMFKNRLVTSGSLASMVIGILSAFLIYIWVDNETSTDRFHKNIDNIYITVAKQSAIDAPQPIDVSLFFNVDYKEYPQVISKVNTALFSEDRVKLKLDDKEFRGRGLVADSTFFEVFDFKLIEGDRKGVLKSPKNIVLSESMARRIFGEEDPIGQTLFFESTRKGYYQVAAIHQDIPSNSSMQFDFIVPMHAHRFWGVSSEEFLLVDNTFDKTEFDEEIKHVGRKHEQFKESVISTIAFKDVYFDYDFSSNLLVKRGDRDEVNTLLLIAIIVLLVSVFNFTNLQTTLMYAQLKTRGIKQVNGASKFDFFMEAFMSRVVFFVLTVGLVYLIFELIKPTYLNFLEVTQNFTWLGVLVYLTLGTVFFILISSLISFLQVSRIVTSQALVGKLKSDRIGNAGKVLTTLQYVFAIVLMIVAAVVYKQFDYMKNKDLGFVPDDVVSVKFFEEIPYDFENPESTREQIKRQRVDYELVKSELTKIAGVESYAQGPMPIEGNASSMPWKLSNSDFEYTDINFMSIEPSYIDILDLELVKGRFFSDSLDRDRQHKVVINEAAMKYWGIDTVEGVKIANSYWSGEEDPWQVIGIVKDFHYEHLSKKVKPLIMAYFNDMEEPFILRLNEERFKTTLGSIETLFGEVNPKRVFEYTVLEGKIQAQYNREKKLSQIFILFTFTGFVISSLGLFTFALYETRKRIKEIGVRKVIGANVNQIIGLLSTSFIKWVLLAFLIASPLAWYFMSDWLSNFANQTTLSWWIFAGAGVLTLVLALFTVIGQTYLAAKRNPVEALRYE